MLAIVRSQVLFFVGCVFFLLLPGMVSAQDAGIGLKPSLIETSADPGDVITETIRVQNLSAQEERYFLFVRDIESVSNGATPVYSDTDLDPTGYELASWVSLGQTALVVGAGQEVSVPVMITVPDTATPGSHFGGIFVSREAPRLRSSGAGVGYQVANIVSIRISGDALESAQIRSLSTDKIIYGSTNVEFTGRVENKGNVLIRPAGPLEIYNMFGSQVAKIEFNQPRNAVFPGTIRDFTLQWADDGLGFGRYEAQLGLVYGEQGKALQSITSSVSFWILPMEIIKPAAIILGILLLASYIFVRLYIRKTVARLSGGRKMVRRRAQQQGPSTLFLVGIVMLVVTALFLIILLALFA